MTLSTIERVIALQRVGLFARTPGRMLAAVAQRAIEVEAAAGAPVIVEGAVEDHLFVVVSGRLRVHRGELTLTDIGPGSTVGELAALVPEPRSAGVTAVEPSLLLRIEKPVLDELLLDQPELAASVIEALVRMIRDRSAPESADPA